VAQNINVNQTVTDTSGKAIMDRIQQLAQKHWAGRAAAARVAGAGGRGRIFGGEGAEPSLADLQETLAGLEALDYRKTYQQFFDFKPYPKQKEFLNARRKVQ
jgi:hypothetical protein